MRRFLCLLIFGAVSLLGAQSGEEGSADLLERGFVLEAMQARALDAAGEGRFDEALEILDAAIAMAPEDALLRDLRLSIGELRLLEEADELPPGEDTSLPDFAGPLSSRSPAEEPAEEVAPPDFAEELFASRRTEDVREFRDALSFTLGGSWNVSNPVYLEDDLFYRHEAGEDPSDGLNLFGDFQYYFAGVDRALGINMRYYGNLLNPEGGERIDQQMDMGLILRGFFRESAQARTILGFRFTTGLVYLNEEVQGKKASTLSNTLNFGVFYRDPLLRHLFREGEFPRKLVVDAGVDYYYFTLSENNFMIRYTGGLSYRLTPNVHLGAALRLLSTTREFDTFSARDLGLTLSFGF